MALIELKGVKRCYKFSDQGESEVVVQALRGVDLTVTEGEFVAIMGPSGSGKSTLMNIMGCLDRPTEGSYFLEGRNVTGMTPDEWAWMRNHKIGFVFQGFNLLPRSTALENVELPLLYRNMGDGALRHRLALQALEAVGVVHRANHLPHQMSGGEQQRVAIARALVTEPTLILADEPTGNLDTKTTDEVMALFADLNKKGMTVIIVTHEPEVAAWCQRVVLFRDGRIVADGTPEQVCLPTVKGGSEREPGYNR